MADLVGNWGQEVSYHGAPGQAGSVPNPRALVARDVQISTREENKLVTVLRLLAITLLLTLLLPAEDFSLTQNGVGPIRVHTTLSYKGKGERLVATATNDSGSAIPYIRLCVKVPTKGCLFEVWNTEQWEPGTQLEWDITSARHVPNLVHEVAIEAFNSGKAIPATAEDSTASAAAKTSPKDGNWQTARILSSDTKTEYFEHNGQGRGLLTTWIANRTTSMKDTWTLLAGKEYTYLILDHDKHPCRFIVGDDVKYVQQKGKVYVLDADARGCKIDILRQERVVAKP
jgi:hypothetical protein